METIKAAHSWPSNAELIADAAALYIKPDDNVLDLTYVRGIWWTKFRPERLRTNDLNRTNALNQSGMYHDDFRATHWASELFDVVAFDPPYVSVGGRKTTTIPDMHDRYGLTDAPTSPAEVQQQINEGLTEAHRILKPGGIALVKCQDYISSGKLWLGTHHTLTHALDLGFTCVDRFEHIGSPRPQPEHRRQVHAHRNLSTLFVFRKSAKAPSDCRHCGAREVET